MSVLKLKCVDQTLTIINAPIIASGGIQENTLEVDFCGTWDGVGKTAIFYMNKDEVYNVPMANDKCIIPHEVTEKDGSLYFGIFGATPEGKRLTTEIKGYKIIKGSFIKGQEPQEPTPNVYETIMSQYGEIDKAYNNIFNNLEATVADMPAKGFINLNNGKGIVSFWVGTKAEYDALESTDNSINYIITDEELELESNVTIADYATNAGNANSATNADISEVSKASQWSFLSSYSSNGYSIVNIANSNGGVDEGLYSLLLAPIDGGDCVSVLFSLVNTSEYTQVIAYHNNGDKIPIVYDYGNKTFTVDNQNYGIFECWLVVRYSG